MAKNPTPQNDPAALAFSAVEDALKDSVFNLDPPAQPAQEKKTEKKPDPARSERLSTQIRTSCSPMISSTASQIRVVTERADEPGEEYSCRSATVLDRSCPSISIPSAV